MSLHQSATAGKLKTSGTPLKSSARSFLSKFTISTKLVAGFAVISLVAAMIGITGLYSINKINATLNNITDVAAPTVETSDDLIALIFESTKVAEEIIGGDDMPEIDPLVEELQSNGLHTPTPCYPCRNAVNAGMGC